MNIEDAKKLQEVEDRSKSNTKRLDEHDEQLKELSNVYIALTKTNDKVDKIESDVSEMKTDLKDIKDKPNKRWDKVIECIISAIVGGFIGYVFFKLGLK